MTASRIRPTCHSHILDEHQISPRTLTSPYATPSDCVDLTISAGKHLPLLRRSKVTRGRDHTGTTGIAGYSFAPIKISKLRARQLGVVQD